MLSLPLYLLYMVAVGPVLPMFRFENLKIMCKYFSVYKICVKYKEEWMTGKAVDDNIESKMDEKFLEFQIEKSTEGLSESSVQFMVQTVFFVIFIYMALVSVKHE